ncbi:MAG: WG repeat-containing protein [Rikenellaceae bacterium]
MKLKKIILPLLIFTVGFNAYGQEYTYPFNQAADPFADSVNHFDLEPFFDKASQLYGYKKDGKVVIDATYDFTQGFSKKGIARVTNKIPGSNVMISPLMMGGYLSMNLTSDNDGLNGFIDKSGKVVIPIKYSVLGLLELYKVVPFGIKKEVNGEQVVKFGLINDSGDIVMDAKYDHIYQQGKIYFATIFKPNYNEIYYLGEF